MTALSLRVLAPAHRLQMHMSRVNVQAEPMSSRPRHIRGPTAIAAAQLCTCWCRQQQHGNGGFVKRGVTKSGQALARDFRARNLRQTTGCNPLHLVCLLFDGNPCAPSASDAGLLFGKRKPATRPWGAWRNGSRVEPGEDIPAESDEFRAHIVRACCCTCVLRTRVTTTGCTQSEGINGRAG